MNKFSIGDRVSHIDEAISGTVIKIDGSQIVLVTGDGFEMQFFEKDLVFQPDSFAKEVSFTINNDTIREKELPKKRKSQKLKPKDRNKPSFEVDLHIHQLVTNEKGMTAHDKLTLQLDTAKGQLDFAIRKKIQKIVFIHGVGEGVLRAELEYLLRRYDNLKFYDADFAKYGQGALEVYIFQNP